MPHHDFQLLWNSDTSTKTSISGNLLVLVCTVFMVVAMCGPDHRHPSKSRLCCVEVTSLDMSVEVVGETYREQAAAHFCVKAIIFNTGYGKLCADPKAQWVKNLIANMTKV
ncbi:C-C motif chemokine 12-like [Archocentrus centrarchus]|uniref:C-C motif chemokine 12-like n=1 Tax=Archocentrus centrarchus TaxID=63155 RepID=UPI0011EA35BE|nr:C-C motif chemokine 12-like [Archocentrus centrarchus]